MGNKTVCEEKIKSKDGEFSRGENERKYGIVKEEDDLVMFQHLTDLKSTFQRVMICDLPTPVHKLENASKALGREIFIKRDDLSNHEFGGNKPRKYEFIIGDILRRKRKIVTTIGALGSNHCFGFSLFAQRFRINTRLYILDQPSIPEVKENLIRMSFFSRTSLIYAKNMFWLVLYCLWDIVLCRRFHPHYFLEPGASDNLGILGYVNAGFEYFEQVKSGECEEVDYIYLPLGTCGTAIGLLIGLELSFGRGKGPKIVAVSVLDSFINKDWKMKSMCKGVVKFIQKKQKKKKIPNIHEYMFERMIVDRDYVGIEYGHPTIEGNKAIELLEDDNIQLDKIYSGKAFSCLIDHCRNDDDNDNDNERKKKKMKVKKGQKVLFWMTKNSADLSKFSRGKNWNSLPKSFHSLFSKKNMIGVKPSKLKKE